MEIASKHPWLPAVPDTQRGALTGALGWTAAEPGGDRFQVFAATLALLAAAAADQPLLIVVDDVQWLDRESAEAILFAARRASTSEAASRHLGASSPAASRAATTGPAARSCPAAARRTAKLAPAESSASSSW